MERAIDALRAALETAIIQGLFAVLAFGVLIAIAALFLKDIPFRGQESEEAASTQLPATLPAEGELQAGASSAM